MKKWQAPVFLIVSIVIFLIYMTQARQSGPQEEWVEIPGTNGIHYNRTNVLREGNMVYVSLRNENLRAMQFRGIAEIRFDAAIYCAKGKIRTLREEIRYEDGFVKTTDENHLESNPNTDRLNETHDLQDISTAPSLEGVYHTFCD